MCLPTAIAAGISAVSAIASYKSEADNYNYQQQIALNNYNNTLEEGYRQKQLGIEAMRKDKINGLKEANYLYSKNASSNFNTNSGTLKQNYLDTIEVNNSNSKEIEEDYDTRAQSYFNQANNYLTQIKNKTTSYNNELFKNSIAQLGKSKKVNSNWYSTGGNSAII